MDPEDAHQGGVITSQTTLCRNMGEKEGEGVFRRGRISETLRRISETLRISKSIA